MKRFLQLLILACLSFAVVGCYQDSTGPEVPVVGNLTLSQEQMNVSAEGGEFSVDIYTEYMFQASTNVDWIEILYGSCTPEYCTQYFNVKANDTTSPREGIITIFCDDYNLSATLTVKQESQNYPFSLTISLDTSRTSLGDKFGYKYPLYWLSEDKRSIGKQNVPSLDPTANRPTIRCSHPSMRFRKFLTKSKRTKTRSIAQSAEPGRNTGASL